MRIRAVLSALARLAVMAGILIGSVLLGRSRLTPPYQQQLLTSLIFLAPFWVPIVLASYAIGQRGIGWRLLIAMAASETAALYGMHWVMLPP